MKHDTQYTSVLKYESGKNLYIKRRLQNCNFVWVLDGVAPLVYFLIRKSYPLLFVLSRVKFKMMSRLKNEK